MTHVSSRWQRPIAALAVGAAALALTACSSDEEPTPGAEGDGAAQEITFLTHWGPDQVAQLEAAAEGFKEIEPDITVTVQAVPFANLLSTLRTHPGSGSGPTIASIYDLWLPELVRDEVAAPAPDDTSGAGAATSSRTSSGSHRS